MTKIAIIGASKGCGLETLKDALARGWTVSAVARHPEQANLKDPRLAWYKGDARNELLIEQALSGRTIDVVALQAALNLVAPAEPHGAGDAALALEPGSVSSK